MCKNAVKTIRRCIDSILEQDYPNIEIVVQDSVSTDGTLEILREYGSKIKLVSEHDSGPTDGMFRALSRIKGEFFGSCLSDEQLLPHAISWGVENLQKHPDVAAIYTDHYITDIDGNITGMTRPQKWDFKAYFCSEMTPPYCSSFFRTDSYKAIGFTEYNGYDEFDFWINLASRFPIRYLPTNKPIAKYAVHPDAMGRQEDLREKRFDSRKAGIEKICNDPQTPQWIRELKDKAIASLYTWRALANCNNQTWDLAKKNASAAFNLGPNNEKLQQLAELIFKHSLELQHNRKLQDAIEFMNILTNANVTGPELNYKRAMILFELGQTDNAINACKEELKVNPNHNEAKALIQNIKCRPEVTYQPNPDTQQTQQLFRDGVQLLKNENPSEALKFLNKAATICPTLSNLHFAIATAYSQLGDVFNAQKACQIELSQYPENNSAQKLLNSINQAIENHNTDLENMCNKSVPYSFSKNSEDNLNDEPKFSFVMIVLNGMPSIEYSLRSIYDFAHEIIIVEGAVENCMFAANPDGSSNDGTVEFIRAFSDPQNKIKLIQGKWPEKCEMQNEALKYVSGNYIWLIDSDEVYKSEDLGKIKQILQNDSSITQVNFIPDNFWKGFDYIFVSQKFFQTECHYRRVFKYTPGATFTTHRPPTMVWPGNTATTEQMNLLDGFKTRNTGIILYHYSYVWEKQVQQKIQLYNRYGWGKQWQLDLSKWYNECYHKWAPWNRDEIEAKYPIWTGDINSHTEPFNGTHPRVMIDYILKTATAQNTYAMKHVVEAIHEVKNSFPQQQVNAIETGTIRSFYEQHFSTYHISNALADKGQLTSVDISPDSIRISKQICSDSTNIEFIESDSIKYLKELKDRKFHFAFLDSVNDKDFIFEEFRLIIPMMLEGSILMIDDAGIEKDGHGLDASVAAQKGHRAWQFLKSCDIEYSVLYTNQGHGTQIKIVMTKENLDNISKNIDNFYSAIGNTESQPRTTLSKNNLTDNQPQPENILWVRTDSIGDAVLSASMLPYIHKKYKDARITVFCQEHIKELYHTCPDVDDVICFDRNRAIHDEQYRETITHSVRELKPYLSLNSVFSREPINDWFAISCAAPQRIAMQGNLSNIQDQQRQQHNQYYTKLIQSDGENKTELERHRDFLKGLDIDAPSLQPVVWIQPEDEQFAENIFSQYNLNPDETIALFAGAQFDCRIYQHYGKALSEFCKKNNFKVIALGSQQDYEINQKNLDAIGVESVNLSGKTTILQTAAIIKLCKMAVGAETALAHIACAVGTHNVILLGGGHFGRFMPYSQLTSIACLPLECYGCDWGCRYRTHHCVKDLAPQVLSEALKQTFEIPSQQSRIFIQDDSLWQPTQQQPKWKSCQAWIKINNVEIINVGSNAPPSERDIDKSELSQAEYKHCRQKPLIATSIAPKNIDRQVAAVQTWLNLGFDVVSININQEIEILKNSFPDVRFIPTKRDGSRLYDRPVIYLDDVLEYFHNADCEICGIVNSDIFLAGDHDIVVYIQEHAKNSIVYGARVDVESMDNLNGEFYMDGFDFFFFDKSIISCFPKSDFCLGLPWWDYWVLLIPILEGIPAKRLDNHFAFHVRHNIKWELNYWASLAKEIFGYLRENIDKYSNDDPAKNPWALLAKMLHTCHLRYLKIKGINNDTEMSLSILVPCFLEFIKIKTKHITYDNKLPKTLKYAPDINKKENEITTINDLPPTTPKCESDNKINLPKKKTSIEIPNIIVKYKTDLPKISIVTPSYNQSKYLEECIDSILSQNYPNLEYIIMDGGSTDGSVEIIKKYEKFLTYWQSIPDGGQYAAIDKGFNISTGEIMTWINSDDKHHPDSLFKAAYIFQKYPNIEWITGKPTAWNAQGQLIDVGPIHIWDGKEHNSSGRKKYYIQQEATFWKRDLWNRAGAKINTQLQFAGDFELWIRFFKYAQLFSIDTIFGGFRHHTTQKTKLFMEKYYQEAEYVENKEKDSLSSEELTRIPPAPKPICFDDNDFMKFKSQVLDLDQSSKNITSSNQYDVSIILSTKDRAQLLDQMLTSLEDAVQDIKYELIVVEGPSSDNTSEILRKHNVTQIYNELECLGPGRHSWSQLYNFGFSKAKGKWAMYASDDIIFSKNCIKNAVSRLNKQNDKIAGGVFFYKNVQSRLDWDKYGIDFAHGSKLLLNYGLVRKDYFDQAGGLDEIYKFYCADSDLCYKLYEAGLQLIPLPESFVFHNNVIDIQKKVNMHGSDNDVEICQNRWKHFVPKEVPKPRRLLWQHEIIDALSITDDRKEINQGIEFFWHGIACLQKGLVEEAEIKFIQSLNSKIDHWLVLWYLAQAAYQCSDNDLAIKVLDNLTKIKPDFRNAKELLNKLISSEKRCPRLPVDNTISKLDFPATKQASIKEVNKPLKKNIICLIFSKNRAMQLQATIESFRLHCKDCDNVTLTVLYKASDGRDKLQYNRLKETYCDITFIEENNFRQQTISILQGSEYILFMVDDNIFTSDFYIIDAVTALKKNTDTIGFSLRLGKNTNYCYPKNSMQSLPTFESMHNGILKFNWTSAQYDFGYPLELSSSLYRTSEFLPLLEQIKFNNPNTLEGVMAENTPLFDNTNAYLLCFDNSVTFCNPVNMVQTIYTNRAGADLELSSSKLADKFEQGLKIDIEKYSGFTPNACHQETELYFVNDHNRNVSHAGSEKYICNDKPRFSIIMTVYNKENFVADAIESVLNQTFQDWELIIVDDCSSDSSPQIINRYLADKRIKLIRNNINLGIAASAKIGIANTTSEYFGILDADDSITPSAIETMYQQHIENPHCGLIYSQFSACDENLNHKRKGFCGQIPTGKTALDADVVSHFKTFKVVDYLKTAGLDENLPVAEDKDIIYKMEEITHLKFVDEPLYLYREMSNPQSHADSNVNTGIMCRAKAKINAIKRRSDTMAELFQLDSAEEFNKDLQTARKQHQDINQYLILLEKLYQNNMLDNLNIPQDIISLPIDDIILWLAAEKYIDFEKIFDSLNKQLSADNPLVTVEMVTYNNERFIGQAIDSVLEQTYENFELLIIDDGSTDRTKQIVESYSDNRMRYIYQPHKNYASGVNRAIKEAKGQFLLRVDSDDFIEPTYLEKIVAYAIKHPEVDYFYPGKLLLVNEEGDSTGINWNYDDFSDNTLLPSLLFKNGFGLIPNPGSLKRRSLFDKVGFYDDLDTVEDFAFLCKNALEIKFKRVIEHADYYYRKVAASNSRRFRPRNKIMADTLNDMVSIYPMEVLCPQITSINNHNLRKKEYYKYVIETFEKHSRNNMVRYKEYFLKYADFYRKCLNDLNSSTAPTYSPESPSEHLAKHHATIQKNTDVEPLNTKHNKYLVTAIVSTYNSEQFLRGCLDNLEDQTIADKLEIIVINSGSQQNEEQIVHEFQKMYDNIVYIKTENREGLYTAWNRAVKVARGNFLTNANTDDRHRRDSLEIMANTMLENPETALVYADQICTDTPNPTFENYHATQMAKKPEYSRQTLLASCCVGSQPMWRSSLHNEFGYFDDSLTCAGDWDFWNRISSKYNFIHIPDFLGIYYHNEQGIEHCRKIHSLYERYIVGKRYGTPYISVIPLYQCRDNPLVSVIIPTYNTADYIADAIESIVIQNYRNFEIIIVDDGSTDNTKDIVDRFEGEEIKYMHQQNKGAPSACNTGIKISNGDYIIRLDADDMMTPDFIAKHLAEFEKHPDADLVYTNDFAIKEDYTPVCFVERSAYKDRKSLIRDMFRSGYPVIPFRNCVRKSVYDKIGLLDETLIVSEDYDMMRRFVKHNLRPHFLDEPLYIRRMTSESISRSYTHKKAKCLFNIINRFTETFTYEELFPDVDWSKIPQQTRKLHAKYMTAVTCLSIGQEFFDSQVPLYAGKAFEQAQRQLNDCLKQDPENSRIRNLIKQCESAKLSCSYSSA
jgi:glycosyltransferase involved in cell wall biosynthesis/ADP-heptose:LPS heptosyltransferase